MASWNSTTLEITYQVLGWSAFLCWAICFYPQLILNYKRKSVVGLNFDFVVLNWTKQLAYLIYNVTLFFSPVVQRQYHEKYGYGTMIPVAANDVAFSLHSLLLMALVAFQILIYERGSQKVSKTCIAITSVVCVVAVVCTIIALPSNSWLWLISVFNIIQVLMTTIKYIPQAFMNYMRKSTEGFSIFFVLLDLLGGLTNLAQMGVESIDQGTFVNFYSNIGKTLLSSLLVFCTGVFVFVFHLLFSNPDPPRVLTHGDVVDNDNLIGSLIVTVGRTLTGSRLSNHVLKIVAFFDLIFIFQHYVLHPSISGEKYSQAGAENTEPLMKPSGESGQVENV